MSFLRGDPKQALVNRQKFLSKFDIDITSVIDTTQIHGKRILKITRSSLGKRLTEADGFMTNLPNIYLMVKAADCHQIAFYDPKNGAIALIHAGFKGLEKGIIKNAVEKMKKNYKSKSKDLIVRFGPAIGPCCYRMDLWKEAENQLKNLGVLPKNIDNPKICTYHNIEYFSHRRYVDQNLPEDFRFATVLGLKHV
ncbi:polyphenol oxidase family protein [Candidatus Daviesbacteria bacterium]|nr:polyphenol oxidase family protein [Candidatus Daviesbacteria bacterium]